VTARPKKAVSPSQPWSRALSPHHRQLLAQGKVLQGDFPNLPWRKKQT